jgi:hypothetical protein
MLGRLPNFFWPFSAHFWEISRICEAISCVRTKFRILGGQIPDPDKNQRFWGNFCLDIKVKKWAKMDLAYIGIFRGPPAPHEDLLDEDGRPARAPIIYCGPHGANSHHAVNLMGRLQLGKIDLTKLLPTDDHYRPVPLPPSRPSQSGPSRTSHVGSLRSGPGKRITLMFTVIC